MSSKWHKLPHGVMCLKCGYKSKVAKQHECKLTMGGKVAIKLTLKGKTYYPINPKKNDKK